MDTVRNELPFYASLAAVVAEVQKRFLYGKGYERICKGWERLKKGLQPAAIGTVCTPRFAHSERKVYKAFFRNLVVFIQDLKSPDRASETGIAAEIAKVSSVVFIVQLMGIIDLLQCVKNLSLLLQTVNQLPWELKDAIKEHCDLMESLAADLKAGKWGRTLPGTAHSDGKRTPALEFLSKHLPEVNQLKLSLYMTHGMMKSSIRSAWCSRRVNAVAVPATRFLIRQRVDQMPLQTRLLTSQLHSSSSKRWQV